MVEAKKELLWWKENLTLCNGRSLTSPAPQIIISSGASLQDWGASCQIKTPGGGSMVHGRTKVQHNYLEEQGSQISYDVLHIKGVCYISSHLHGQHDSPVILNENGGGVKKPGVS